MVFTVQTSLIPLIDPSFKDNTEKSHKIYIEQTENTKKVVVIETKTFLSSASEKLYVNMRKT